MQRRLNGRRGAMQIMRRTAEQPFGTPKAQIGATHFLARPLEPVPTGISL